MISSEPQIREYEFNITEAYGAADGWHKPMLLKVKSYVDRIYSITKPLSTIEADEKEANKDLYKIDDVEILEMVSVYAYIQGSEF